MTLSERAARLDADPSRVAAAAAAGVLVLEAIGSLMLWAPIPLAWMWVGGRVYDATGSLGADLGAAFAGFVATTVLAMNLLTRLDRFWITMRRAAGHRDQEGVLTRVVVASAALGLLGFAAWYYVLGGLRHGHFVIPFMPQN